MRNIAGDMQRFRLFLRRFTAFDRVDHIMLHRGKFFFRNASVQCIYLRGAYYRLFSAGDELDTLRGALGSHIELTGQIFGCKHSRVISHGELVVHLVELRLGKYGSDRSAEQIGGYALGVVAVEQAYRRYRFNTEKTAYIGKQRVRFRRKAGLFFYEDSVYHPFITSPLSALPRRYLFCNTHFRILSYGLPHMRFLPLRQGCPPLR